MFRTSYTEKTGVSFYANAKSERRFHEHRKLYAMARDYILSHPDMMLLGEDPLADHLLSSSGFSPHDIAVLRIVAKGKLVTALCVPTRLWRDPEARNTLLELKRDAIGARTSCVLVPQASVKAPVRAARARLISRARNTGFSRAQMQMVLQHLGKVRISTIAEAACCVVGHDDPMGVVLALIGQGLVTYDRRYPLGPDTFVSSRLPDTDVVKPEN